MSAFWKIFIHHARRSKSNGSGFLKPLFCGQEPLAECGEKLCIFKRSCPSVIKYLLSRSHWSDFKCTGPEYRTKLSLRRSVIGITNMESHWKSLECASVAELNEDFPIESLRASEYIRSPVFVSVSLPLSPCLSSLSSLLGSQLALFLWPFDLSERVWSFKVLLFPLSGAPLFLLSGLGFQSDGSPGAVAGWVGRRGEEESAGFCEAVRLR